MFIAILGRQPLIGLAELESLYGADKVRPVGNTAALVDTEKIDHARLGGTVKVAKPLTELSFTDWKSLSAYTALELPKHVCCLGEGKLKLGISTYGVNVSVKQLFASGLEFKKVCKQSGRSTRVVPNTELALNSAQVLHNKLAGDPLGMELLYIRNGNKTWLAQTVSVQDVDAYAKRDHGRPKRDARVGMLPPKLAQTIVNLATGATPPSPEYTVLDPFCGTGVVMQEALLMGFSVAGTDIDQRMVDYSIANVIDWFNMTVHPEIHASVGVALGDATSHQWQTSEFLGKGHEVSDAKRVPLKIDFIASETYLGRPLTTLPAPDKLREITGDCNVIIEKFLKNIRKQLPRSARLCLAVPAWDLGKSFKHLPLLDHLESLGYNRVKFKHAAWSDLVYHREGQVVARELLVLTVKD